MMRMGRGKIEIRKIENLTNRQVTFSKRKAGLKKKAKELSILCGAEVALIIFSSNGKHYEYSSPCSSIEQILEKYITVSGSKLGEDQINTFMGGCVVKDDIEFVGLHRVFRHMTGEDLESLSVNELQNLEDQLEIVTSRVRKKRFQLTQEKLKAMTEEVEESRRRLRYYEGFQEKKNDLYMFSDCRGLGETVDDYPFCQLKDKNPTYLTSSAAVPPVLPVTPRLHETDYQYLDLQLGHSTNLKTYPHLDLQLGYNTDMKN